MYKNCLTYVKHYDIIDLSKEKERKTLMTVKEFYEWCCQNNIENYQIYTYDSDGYINYNVRLGEIQTSNVSSIKIGGTIEIDTQKKEIFL